MHHQRQQYGMYGAAAYQHSMAWRKQAKKKAACSAGIKAAAAPAAPVLVTSSINA